MPEKGHNEEKDKAGNRTLFSFSRQEKMHNENAKRAIVVLCCAVSTKKSPPRSETRSFLFKSAIVSTSALQHFSTSALPIQTHPKAAFNATAETGSLL